MTYKRDIDHTYIVRRCIGLQQGHYAYDYFRDQPRTRGNIYVAEPELATWYCREEDAMHCKLRLDEEHPGYSQLEVIAYVPAPQE